MTFRFREWRQLSWDDIKKINIKCFRNSFFVEYLSGFHSDKIGKRGISDSFVSNNFFHNIPCFFINIFVWIDKIWIIVFLLFHFQKFEIFCIVYNSVLFQGSYSSKLFHTIFVSSRWFYWTFSHPRAIKTFFVWFLYFALECLIVKAPPKFFKIHCTHYLGNFRSARVSQQ